MKVPFLDLKAEYATIKTEIDAAMRAVVEQTAFVGGAPVKAFEAAFAAWMDLPHCIGCGNGTDSIEILLGALGVKPGDEVIVPAHTWISTSEAVSNVGARPVFADTLPRSYVIDPASIRARLTSKTRAIIPVHLYGLPASMDEVMAIAREHDLRVIEDCAQAHGALFKGQKVGTFGDAASFSFYPGKNLGAYGDAGCIATRSAEVARRCRLVANHGQLTKHEHEIEGRNSRLDAMQAAVLSAKLPNLDRWNEARRAHAARYDERLTRLGIETGARPKDRSSVFHIYAVEVPSREQVMARLRDDGIESAVHYPRALPALPAYRDRGYDPGTCPVAVAATSRVLSLPMFPALSDEAIDFVCERLGRALESLGR